MILAEIFPLEEPANQLPPKISPRTEDLCDEVTELMKMIRATPDIVTEQVILDLATQGYRSHEDFAVLTQKMDLPREVRWRVMKVIQEAVDTVETYIMGLDFGKMIQESAARHYRLLSEEGEGPRVAGHPPPQP